jgi:hypothetical protein
MNALTLRSSLFFAALIIWGVQGTLLAQPAPVITSQPSSVTLVAGQASTFSVTATGSGLRFLWYRDGVLFFTSPVLSVSPATSTISGVEASRAGAYRVRVTDSAGRIIESAVWQVVVSAFSVSVSATPALPATVNVGSAVRLQATVTPAGTYRYQWSRSGRALSGATAATLALSAATPADAGVYQCAVTDTRSVTLNSSDLQLQVTTGTGSLRIVNSSTRLFVGTGDQVLITGFVLEGSGGRSLLVRAVGPGLAPFGVTGVLQDPQLTVYDSAGRVLAANNDWPSSLGPIMSGAGAFGLTSGSRDAALVVYLGAGAFTFMVSGVNNTSGNALLEVYELP